MSEQSAGMRRPSAAGTIGANPNVVQEALRLIGRVEVQSRELQDLSRAAGVSARSFQDYKRFVEKVEHFYVFVDLVEGRIPDFDHTKQEPLRRHLSKIRWKVTILELESTRIYLINITEAGRQLPLGAREFLMRRLDRLSEIAEYYDRFADAHTLSPPADELIRAVEALLRAGIEQAPAMDEFSRAEPSAALPRRSATPAPTLPGTRGPGSFSITSFDRYGNRSVMDAPMTAPLPPIPDKVNIKEAWGRFYMEKGQLVAVTQACKAAALSLDQLASRVGVSRVAFTLMLSGQDPMPRKAIEALQEFMGQQAENARRGRSPRH